MRGGLLREALGIGLIRSRTSSWPRKMSSAVKNSFPVEGVTDRFVEDLNVGDMGIRP
jgi:hypothetical protein